VVVVGAGPAGSALALQLARAGVAVELVESQPRHSALIRGDGLMPSGLEALNRMGLAPLLEALPRRELQGWSFHLEGRPLFSVDEPMGGPVPCSLIDTPALLEGLLERAMACPSLSLRRGRAVKELLLDPELQMTETSRPGSSGPARVAGVVLDDGTRLPADLVVGCDGRGSTIRRLAGLELDEDNPALEVLWFELENGAAALLRPWIAGRFATLLGEGGSYALFGTARGGVRLGWLQERGAAGSPIPWPERWARSSPPELAALWRSLPPSSLGPPLRLAVRSGLARRWQRPGLLLLGDAAHPMSPLRAQGLNMALRDAWVAAEWLLPVLRGEGTGPAGAAGADGAPAWHGPSGPARSSRADGFSPAVPGPADAGPFEPGRPCRASGEGGSSSSRPAAPAPAAVAISGRRERLQHLDQALVAVAEVRRPEIRTVQALQRQEMGRGELLRRQSWLRQLLAASAGVSGPLLSRRWQAGQPTLRAGLPLPAGPSMMRSRR
jgi:2-polyprenyl-6-methoxyphenol hydroxylase-like FAD-dependent oxidoreductase